eukprot:TRINITY_DN8310_c0_g2_i3.p1 TRINITY_DN8310_c0_g2~~TRINITY_DN8310_c0_g2_i3.p1  ORF type:complete len:304 (-),score=67.64 TRINITY_DN8310_c0_g2_i3:181-1092(-)
MQSPKVRQRRDDDGVSGPLPPGLTNDSSQGQEHSKDPDMDLDEGATSIVLRSLSPDVTLDALLAKLDEVASGKYDFVYLPYSSRKNVNIALSFINFVDHETANRAYHILKQEADSKKPNASSGKVRQAKVQGLAANLAYFVATAGIDEVNNPHAPKVFKNGERCDLLKAINEHVSCQLLLDAQEEAKKLKDNEKANSRGRTTRSNASSYSGHSQSSRSSASVLSGSQASSRSRRSYDRGPVLQQQPQAPQRRIRETMRDETQRSMGSDGMPRSAFGHAGYRNPIANYMGVAPGDDDDPQILIL